MEKYIYKGKVVYVLNQTDTQIIYGDDSKKNTPLKSIGIDVFFKNARKYENNPKKVLTVSGTKPIKKKIENIDSPIIEDKKDIYDDYL